MQPVLNFAALTASLKAMGRRWRVAVVCGTDRATLEALMRGTAEGFIEPWLFIPENFNLKNLPGEVTTNPFFHIIPADSDEAAARAAVAMARRGEADLLMKGLIHTDTLLRAVLNKEEGILPRGRLLTHIAAAELPGYPRLLFFSDAAVIPYPTHEQRVQQVAYMIETCHAFGIEEPRIALIHCAETASEKFPHTMGYAEIAERAARGEWGRAIVSGPLDFRTSCDAVALATKGISSPIAGSADGLILPDIEAGNLLYKVLPLFAGAKMAGMLKGPQCPVVLSSRADDAETKYRSLCVGIMNKVGK